MKVIDLLTEQAAIESVESASPAEVNQAKIAALEDELAHLPKTPQTQSEYDEIDRIKDKIQRLKAGAAE